MRKIILLMHVSLDGFVAGPNGEMDWIRFDGDLEAHVHQLHATTDTAIYGRKTFEMMASYWPTVLDDPNSEESARDHARWLQDATKIVVSTTLDQPAWAKTVVLRENFAEELARIKAQPGKDLWLIGSPTLVHSLMQHDLIDEYRLNVNPVAIGSGIPLFAGLDHQIDLRLLETKTFDGVVALRYERARS